MGSGERGYPATGAARCYVRQALEGWSVGASDIDSVGLVVSELVTNSVRHACPTLISPVERMNGPEAPISLALQRVSCGVLVTVFDRSPVMPSRVDGSVWDEAGRGLGIVAALSAEWGAIPYSVDEQVIGKTVWARCVCRTAPWSVAEA